jgi:hypothetical protein
MLGFEEVFVSGIYGNQSTPVGAAAAEAVLAVSALFPFMKRKWRNGY